MHPKWRVVVSSEFLSAGASDRYVAIAHGFTTDQLTLIDEHTGTSQTPSIGPCGGAENVLLFGGPWLLAQCSIEPGTPCCSVPPYALYNLDSGQWTDFHISPQAKATRQADRSRYLLVTRPCCLTLRRTLAEVDQKQFRRPGEHQTGEAKPAPNDGRLHVFDDLGAPSG